MLARSGRGARSTCARHRTENEGPAQISCRVGPGGTRYYAALSPMTLPVATQEHSPRTAPISPAQALRSCLVRTFVARRGGLHCSENEGNAGQCFLPGEAARREAGGGTPAPAPPPPPPREFYVLFFATGARRGNRVVNKIFAKTKKG